MKTLKELRAIAKARGLKGYSKLNRIQLEDFINAAWIKQLEQQEAQAAQSEGVTLMAKDSNGTLSMIVEGNNVSYEEFSGQKPTHQDAQQTTHKEKKSSKGLTLEQVIELLGNAEDREQITSILNDCTRKLLHELAESEHICNYTSIYHTKKDDVKELANVLVWRLSTINAGKKYKIKTLSTDINLVDGMTPLLIKWTVRYNLKHSSDKKPSIAERFAAKAQAQAESSPVEDSAATVSAVEPEPYDDAVAYTPDYEANEAVLQDTPEQEYSGDYSLPFTSTKPATQSKPKSKRTKPIIFEVGKTYTATDRENKANTLTFTVLDRYNERPTIHMTGTGKYAGAEYDYTGISNPIFTITENGQKIEYMTFGGYVSRAPMTERDRLIGGTMATRYVWYADRPDAPKPEDPKPAPVQKARPEASKTAPKPEILSEVYKPEPLTSAHHFAFKWDIDRMNSGIKTREEYFADTGGISEEEYRARLIRSADDMLGIHIPETYTLQLTIKVYAERVAYIVNNYSPEPDLKEAWKKAVNPDNILLRLVDFYGARCLHDIQAEHYNELMLKLCNTHEELEALLLTTNSKSTLWWVASVTGAIGDNNTGAFFDSHDEDFFRRLCVSHLFPETVKAESVKPTPESTPEPAPATQTVKKTRRPRKVRYDDGQQLTFGFEEDKEHEQLLIPLDSIATPARKKTRGTSQPRKRSVRRKKYDDSQQIAIAFEVEPDAQLSIPFVEEVTGGEIEQREAA